MFTRHETLPVITISAAPQARFGAVVVLLASLISIGGCGLLEVPPPLPAPTRSQIENATYAGILEHPLTLRDGSYGKSRPGILLWRDLISFGDLDDTPGDEAAVLLSQSSGGNGERIYLAIVGMRDGQAVDLGTGLVGGGVKIRAMQIADGRVLLDVVEAGASDAACCPTQLARKVYELHNPEVRLVSTEAQGPLSTKTLAGVDWRLIALDGQAPRIIRLPALMVAGDRLNGFGGCTTYTGIIEETAPGEIVVSSLNRTPATCPPAETNVEQEFLPRLEKVDRYTFLAGQLALSGVHRGNRFQLLLKAYASRRPENPAR